MKKFLVFIASFLFFSPVFAGEAANIQLKIKNAPSNNAYFLCLPNLSCISIYAGAHGKVFPIDPGLVNRIVMIDIQKRKTYAQAVPDSCNVDLKSNQTMTISGKIVHAENEAAIKNLKCKVVG